MFDGFNIRILNPVSLPVVIPPVYGLKGVGFETYTGDGPISYWNSYVGVSQMGGHGTFRDRRIGVFIDQTPDRVTPKLPALVAYQLSLETPKAPFGSFDRRAASRGRRLFYGDGELRHVSLRAGAYRCIERPARAVPARCGRDRRRSKIRGSQRHRTVPDDAASRAMAARAIFS